jgi:hypothetical protein
MDRTDLALLELGRDLKKLGYKFTTITPASHARVIRREVEHPASLEQIFGWSHPFLKSDLGESHFNLLANAGALEASGSLFRSKVRFSTLGRHLYVHSAYPTENTDAVFFGPDTYRFARGIRSAIQTMKRPDRSLRIIDIGTGTGVGGLHAAALSTGTPPSLVLTDVNDRALRFCTINAALAGADGVHIIQSDLFNDVPGFYDLIISNPPYLLDPLVRAYRHGGGSWGSELSLRIVAQGMDRLAPGGRLFLYTGSPVVAGKDIFYEELCAQLARYELRFDYEEIDPDVFGEELEHPPYNRVDRIAAVGVTIDIPSEIAG